MTETAHICDQCEARDYTRARMDSGVPHGWARIELRTDDLRFFAEVCPKCAGPNIVWIAARVAARRNHKPKGPA